MTTSNFLIAVRTSPDTSEPVLFDSNNLSDTLHSWFRHALNTSHDPKLCLPQLFEFLQQPGIIFFVTSNVGGTDHPEGALRLLSVVYDPSSIESRSSNIQIAVKMYPDLGDKIAPYLHPLYPNEFALVFQTAENEILVWHARQQFDTIDFGPAPVSVPAWRAKRASDLQIRQDTKEHPLPVIPAYLCESIALEDVSATFIVGNDTKLADTPPLHVPVAMLLRLFDNQLNLLPFLRTLPPAFEVSIAYCSRYNSNPIRRCSLRMATLGPGSCAAPFYLESTFVVPATDIDSISIPQLLIHLKNYLTSYFQWQALQRLFHSHGFTLVPKVRRWIIPNEEGATASPWYVQWPGSEPGGYARLPNAPADIQRFGAYDTAGSTPDIVPSPLEGLSAIWGLLQTHLQNLQMAQLQC